MNYKQRCSKCKQWFTPSHGLKKTCKKCEEGKNNNNRTNDKKRGIKNGIQ